MAEDDQDDAAPAHPPWNWRELTEDERTVELDDLTDWVLDLQVNFGRWVWLPPCWSCHAALRSELAAFWYWRQHLDRTPGASAEENVRWYHALRGAAQAWTDAYAGCRHESLGEVDERRTDREAERLAARRFQERALQPSRPDGC